MSQNSILERGRCLGVVPERAAARTVRRCSLGATTDTSARRPDDHNTIANRYGELQ